MAFASTTVTIAAPSSFFRSHLRSCLPPPPSSPSSPPSLPASPLTRSHCLPPLVLPLFGNGSSDPPSAPPLPPSPTTPPQPPTPLPCSLSPSLLLDPPSASLHCVFHCRSPPRSPPLSTVGRLPLLPLRCTPISATTIVTTPASPLPSPSVVAIFRPHRPPASPSSPPLPPFSATALTSLPRPPLSSTTIAALRPSTSVTKTERHRRCHHRCLCSPFFLFSAPPTVPPCRSLSSPSAHHPRPGRPSSSPPGLRRREPPLSTPPRAVVTTVAVPHPCQLHGKALPCFQLARLGEEGDEPWALGLVSWARSGLGCELGIGLRAEWLD